MTDRHRRSRLAISALFSWALLTGASAAQLRITEGDFVFRKGRDYRISLELVLSEEESRTIKPEPLWGAFEFVRHGNGPNLECHPIMEYEAPGVSPLSFFIVIGTQRLDTGVRDVVVLDTLSKKATGLFVSAIPDPDNAGYTDVYVEGVGSSKGRSWAKIARGIEINTNALPPGIEWVGSHPGDDDGNAVTVHHLFANHGTELVELGREYFRNLPANYKLQRLLLASGAAPAPRVGRSNNTTVIPERTPVPYSVYVNDPNYKLSIAMVHDDLASAEKLLQSGADPNRDYDWNIFNPLCEAAAGNKVRFIRLFIEHGAKVDGKMSMQDTTPLMVAAETGAIEAFDLLLECGADYKLRSTADWNALAYAAHNPFGAKMLVHIAANHPEIVAEPNSLNEALLAAADAGASQCVKELLRLGADVNVRDKSDETPLICTCRWGYAKVARILLQAGADVNAVANWNETALDEAVSGNNPTTVRVLLEAGADPSIRPRTNPQITPLELAREKGFHEIVRLLQSHSRAHGHPGNKM